MIRSWRLALAALGATGSLTVGLATHVAAAGPANPADPSHLTNLSQCPVLAPGLAGSCVSELQTLLNARGAHLQVDGIFGQQTEDAVLKFQRDNHLTPDGQVGPQTDALLDPRCHLYARPDLVKCQ